jgi:hypothetical protein
MMSRQIEFEHCCECDAHTGRAGRVDDSLYAGGRGPFCEDCYGELPDQLVDECDVKAARIADLEARLAAAESQPAVPEGWRPIETAPKDGTRVRLLSPEGEDVGFWEENRYCVLGSPQGSFGEGWVDGENRLPIYAEFTPTHWMPLPAAPQGGGK